MYTCNNPSTTITMWLSLVSAAVLGAGVLSIQALSSSIIKLEK